MYAVASTAPVAEEVEPLTPDEVVAIDMSEAEIDAGEIDNKTDRKVFSLYLPLVSQ